MEDLSSGSSSGAGVVDSMGSSRREVSGLDGGARRSAGLSWSFSRGVVAGRGLKSEVLGLDFSRSKRRVLGLKVESLGSKMRFEGQKSYF